MNPRPPLPSVRGMSAQTWHATPAGDVAAELQAGPDGLSAADAHARLERFGPNRLPEASGPSALELFTVTQTAKNRELDGAVDRIREKFGRGSLTRGGVSQRELKPGSK